MMTTEYFAQDEHERQTPDVSGEPLAEQHPQSLRRCANCDIEIAWSPIISGGMAYCCLGCAQGGPCSCDYAEHANTPPGSDSQSLASIIKSNPQKGVRQGG